MTIDQDESFLKRLSQSAGNVLGNKGTSNNDGTVNSESQGKNRHIPFQCTVISPEISESEGDIFDEDSQFPSIMVKGTTKLAKTSELLADNSFFGKSNIQD